VVNDTQARDQGNVTCVIARREALRRAMIVAMASFDFADMVVTFLALLGPQKVLVSFGRIARTLDSRSRRVVAVLATLTAAGVGVVLALAAPWIAHLFHIGTPDLELAAGLVFFIYAVGQVFGVHFDPVERAGEAEPTGEVDPSHKVISGFRAMLLPFVVSPLAVAADLQESLSASDWGTRWEVAGAFALVAVIDGACMLLSGSLLARVHESVLEVASRLLGVLLAALGVAIFLTGLSSLGVLPSGH
jgi:multiple antibiotic resistance protein